MTVITEVFKPLAAISGGESTTDRIRHVKLSTLTLSLPTRSMTPGCSSADRSR